MGHLLIVGGALRASQADVHEKLLELAGGRERARIGIFRTASSGWESSRRMKEELERYGLHSEQAVLFDITPDNAAEQAHDPQVAADIRACSGAYFVGGDQLRITRAFFQEDGSDTPALAALREVYDRGGVIAGTSAGAAVMSETMMSACGVPLDTLEEGLSASPEGKGAHVSLGFGFFQAGVIDQHFNTFDGRPARLARVLIEQQVRLGFGVDENTAMWVRDGEFVKVLGAGGVMIVDVSEATLTEGAHGVRMEGVLLNYLECGDAYNSRTGGYVFHPNKTRIERGEESYPKGGVIGDLGQMNAFRRAITVGLADSTGKKQRGLLMRYGTESARGYQFTFQKTERTKGYYGLVDGVASYAVRQVLMNVEPIVAQLFRP